VGADAEHHRALFLELGKLIAEGASLLGAAGSIIPWIKVEDDVFAMVIGQRDFFSRLRGRRKVRRSIAFLQFQFNFFAHTFFSLSSPAPGNWKGWRSVGALHHTHRSSRKPRCKAPRRLPK